MRLRSPGDELGEPGRELDRGRMGVAPHREVAEAAALLRADVGELLATVARLHHEQPRQRVEVALAVVVVEPAALAVVDDRHGMVVVGAHAAEVQPEVAGAELLEARGWSVIGFPIGTSACGG